MEGCIEYAPGELPFFPERTVIGVDPYPVAYHLLRRCHINTKIETVGEMPPDFPARLKKAIENRPDWNRARKNSFLQKYGLLLA